MDNTSWIKSQLNKIFSRQVTNEDLQNFVADKLKMFNCKLYKYYSFSPNDANYSIRNFENNVIYFSLPQKFNDPFDCVMGISLDELTGQFLKTILNNELTITDKNSDLAKAAVEGLLTGKHIDTDDPTVKLIVFLLKQSDFRALVEQIKDGHQVPQESIQAVILKQFTKPEFLIEYFSLITNPNSTLDLGQAVIESKSTEIIQRIFQDPDLLTLFCPNYEESRQTVNIIGEISRQEKIVDKIKALARLGGADLQLDGELDDIKTKITSAIQSIKDKINEMFGISCFARRNDNILMWSHYANKHTGFCVEYDLSKLKSQEAMLMLYPVIYSNKRPLLPLSMFDFSDIKNVKVVEGALPYAEIVESLLTKSDIWSYEEEWRIIHTLNNLDDQKLYEDIITGVYLGANINADDEKLIIEKATAKGIPVKKMQLLEDQYEVEIVDV
ncbi:MAG: DUF2971 domain-containing protein [Clostridia bacterium]|nr:DUF2971 domain-containing protein [Clostridia bacterium]